VDTGRRILDETIGQARDLVSGLIRRADMGWQTVRIAQDQPRDLHPNP
jgi:hypothetical protein